MDLHGDSSFICSEAKCVHNFFFDLRQLSALFIFHSEHIRTSTVKVGAGNGFVNSGVLMKAAAGVANFGPTCFVMQAARCGLGCGAHRRGSERLPSKDIRCLYRNEPYITPASDVNTIGRNYAGKMKKCVWVRPKLAVVIEFLEWTEADR